MGERLALSFGLGLFVPFALQLLNMGLGMNVNFLTSALVTVFMTVAGIFLFINRGGNPDLRVWYSESKA
jgi:hypothetical protein